MRVEVADEVPGKEGPREEGPREEEGDRDEEDGADEDTGADGCASRTHATTATANMTAMARTVWVRALVRTGRRCEGGAGDTRESYQPKPASRFEKATPADPVVYGLRGVNPTTQTPGGRMGPGRQFP
jgi:hypothetical protein